MTFKIKEKDHFLEYLQTKLLGDVLNWEQLGIVVRYVRNCQAIEKLLEFVQCDEVKGASIAEFSINALNNAGLYS